MSKTLAKYDFYGEFKSHQKALKMLGKTTRVLSKLFELENASSMTSKQIDEAVIIAFGENSPEELNGLQISDPLNHYLLVRQNNIWKKVKLE